MDDAEAWRRSTRATDAADAERQIESYLVAWRALYVEEGELPIVEHARRVVGGTAAGHWCDCAPEQREAARRFLTGVSR